jgi:outer membrane protein assembly factor BamB
MTQKMMGVLVALICSPMWSAQEKTPAKEAYVPAPGHWPQWRGPNRDNVSTETGLLKAWPEGGPKLLWKAAGAGDGGGPVSVAGGLIFVLGSKEDKYCITAFDGSGNLVWDRPIGPKTGEYSLMRFLGQCSVTVDDDRVYACTAQGRLTCMKSGNGETVWEKDYEKDLAGKKSYFAYRESPLVDGQLLICAVGGPKGTLAALDKKSGAPVWRSADLTDPMPQSAVVAAVIGGARQYVVLTMRSVAGIHASDGRLLWRSDFDGRTLVASTPIVHDETVLVTSGYGIGWGAFKIVSKDGRLQSEPLYSGKQTQHHRSVTLVGDHVYAADRAMKCFDFKTGTPVWTQGSSVTGAVLAADGSLIVRDELRTGLVLMCAAAPDQYQERGRFTQPDPSNEGGFNQPVLAGGRLYLRDLDAIYCYDLRGPDYQEPAAVWRIARGPKPAPPPDPGKGPDAAFVATPQDVVEKMIEAAKITRDDVVYDLGSGDGRIVITASRNHGCKSVGFEINPGLVWESRLKAKQQKVDDLVTIQEKDLFSVDLQPASVVTLYLGAPNNAKLLPQLKKLKPGSRIVSHAHLLGAAGPTPDREIKVVSKDDQMEHTIYLWTLPLKEEKSK